MDLKDVFLQKDYTDWKSLADAAKLLRDFMAENQRSIPGAIIEILQKDAHGTKTDEFIRYLDMAYRMNSETIEIDTIYLGAKAYSKNSNEDFDPENSRREILKAKSLGLLISNFVLTGRSLAATQSFVLSEDKKPIATSVGYEANQEMIDNSLVIVRGFPESLKLSDTIILETIEEEIGLVPPPLHKGMQRALEFIRSNSSPA